MTVLEKFSEKLNTWTKNSIPYLFIVDFEMKNPKAYKLCELEKENIYYSINNKDNFKKKKKEILDTSILVNPITKKEYKKGFEAVKNEILLGNSYLLNLTFSNKISFKNPINLLDVLMQTKAKYKLYYKDEFISFTPESFIKIKENTIYTFPMKGTIDASVLNAKDILLNDKKESEEHNTIVDLLRNDLSIVSENIKINRFKYIDKIETKKGKILQMSSEIQGNLPSNWKENFGDILVKLLPAGSICGAPKQKTVEIIKQTETHKRKYYTGVFGVFDGKNIDSAVLIRFIEKNKNQFIYKSGGGITYQSNIDKEYAELLQKIYIPNLIS